MTSKRAPLDPKIQSYLNWLEDRGQAYPLIDPNLGMKSFPQVETSGLIGRKLVFISTPVTDRDEKLMATRMLQALKLKKEEFAWIRVEVDIEKHLLEINNLCPNKIICFGETLALNLTKRASVDMLALEHIELNGQKKDLLIFPELEVLKQKPKIKAHVWQLFQTHLL
jgi:hypothetical protein